MVKHGMKEMLSIVEWNKRELNLNSCYPPKKLLRPLQYLMFESLYIELQENALGTGSKVLANTIQRAYIHRLRSDIE
jgi:hypothetical protein